MSDTKGNLITRLPETAMIALLATACGYLINEARSETETEQQVKTLESQVEDLQKDFDEMHPRQR